MTIFPDLPIGIFQIENVFQAMAFLQWAATHRREIKITTNSTGWEVETIILGDDMDQVLGEIRDMVSSWDL